VDIPATITPELEERLIALRPWMHAYRLADDTFLGTFKYQLGGAGTTVCTPSSPAETIEATRRAYEEVVRGDPLWRVRLLAERGLLGGTALDIASATGMHSFGLADVGAPDVLGVEIRPEQVEQAQLLKSLAPERFSNVRFAHEPTSADDARFRQGESYDVVLSLGLLYHLSDPVEHLRNLRRLTRRALLLTTLTSPGTPGSWQLVLENPDVITKAVGGVSWIPHWASVPELLKELGFDRVEIVAPPRLAELQAWDRREHPSWELGLPVGAVKLLERIRSRRYVARSAAAVRLGLNARYYTYLAT
jgi:SAM-dependent methyltransferase